MKKKETLEQSKSLYFVENEDDYIVKNIIWPNIGDFNETIAAQKIEEFIKKVNFLKLIIPEILNLYFVFIKDLGV